MCVHMQCRIHKSVLHVHGDSSYVALSLPNEIECTAASPSVNEAGDRRVLSPCTNKVSPEVIVAALPNRPARLIVHQRRGFAGI